MRDDIKEKGLSADEVYDRATWRRVSSYMDPHIKVYIYIHAIIGYFLCALAQY